MSFAVSLFLLSLVTAEACAIPGVFIVLRGQSMLIDALSHAVLPGIVIGVALTGSLHSPVMTLTATGLGLIVVWVSHELRSRGLLIGDADQGIIFPAIFAIGVLLLSTVFAGVGVSGETVLAGDLNLLALSTNHIIVGSLDLGPIDMWIQLAMLAVFSVFLAVAGRVLTASTFDRAHAQSIAFPVRRVEVIFMVLIAATVVTAFSVAGSILVVAFMICPVATAVLMAPTLSAAFSWTALIAAVNSVAGFGLSYSLELATAPTLAVVSGVTFLLVLATTTALKR